METDTTYTPPPMLQSIDDDEIHARMLEALPSDIDKTEGGFAYDFTRPAALEKASAMMDLNEAIQIFFPAWSYGAYLDQIAAESGMSRRGATASAGYLTVTGAENQLIPAGFLFATPSAEGAENVLFEVTEDVTIGSSLSAQVYVQCTQTGTVGNVPAGSITLMAEPMGGIMTITNEEPMTGGTEEEDDDSLRARIQERDLNGEISYVGNISDYKRWAQEVTGVGNVTVVPEWKGAGTGTVKLIIMDANGQPANPTILNDVYNHIMSPDDEDARLAPIGAILTVVTDEVVEISVSATLQLEEGAVLGTVIEQFKEAFAEYFEEAKEEGYVRITRVGSILSETSGVLDYTNLKINQGTANIPIAVEEYPGMGDIELVVSE